jgi:hypothetical protein
MLRSLILAATVFAGTGFAHATPVTPVTYEMLNGTTGSYQYWDESYSGSGNPLVSLSPLSGGTGDLTDGYIETRNWNAPGVESAAGPGPYVGWENFSPTIAFQFDQVYAFTGITFHFDTSNAGGVSRPLSVGVTGVGVFGVPNETVDPAPYAFTIPLAVSTDFLTVEIQRRSSWFMLSEVTFEADMPAVPLPATGLLLAGALGAMALRRRG